MPKSKRKPKKKSLPELVRVPIVDTWGMMTDREKLLVAAIVAASALRLLSDLKKLSHLKR